MGTPLPRGGTGQPPAPARGAANSPREGTASVLGLRTRLAGPGLGGAEGWGLAAPPPSRKDQGCANWGGTMAGWGLRVGPSLRELLEQPQSLGAGMQTGESTGTPTPRPGAAAGCGVRHMADGTRTARAGRRAGGSPTPPGAFLILLSPSHSSSDPLPHSLFLHNNKASHNSSAAGPCCWPSWGSTFPLRCHCQNDAGRQHPWWHVRSMGLSQLLLSRPIPRPLECSSGSSAPHGRD